MAKISSGRDNDRDAAVDRPWVTVRSGSGFYALSMRDVLEMASMPPVTAVPHTPSHVRGVINLRGRVLPLVDLRVRLGLASLAESTDQLIQLLAARHEDHQRWVDELLRCVRERRRFTLATDPHACAFGTWYDGFKTDHLLLQTVIRRFEEPHRRLHEAGGAVAAMLASGSFNGCEALAREVASKLLPPMSRLFGEAQAVLREGRREIAVVIEGAGQTFAIAVDAVESVERLASVDAPEALVACHSACFGPMARRRDGRLVLTLEVDGLLSAPLSR